VDSLVLTEQYINSKTLFDVTYACRMGNGTILSKEGSRYLGMGYIHLTGKEKFVGKASISSQKEWKDTYPNIDLATQAGMDKLVTDVEVAIFASMVYWKMKGINEEADKGIDVTDSSKDEDNPLISNVGKLVNGTNPPNGNSTRIKNTKKAYDQLK
jgi:predicted chitinase